MARLLALILPLMATACVPSLYTEAGQLPWAWDAPENSWPLTEPPEGTIGTGFGVGDTIPDVRLMDQHGDMVSFWQFYGRVIVLDVSTMWCGPCQDLAMDTEHMYQSHIDDLMYLTVLHEDQQGEAPTIDDLNHWADSFGITAPVLADGEKETEGALVNGQYPAVLVVDRDLVVYDRIEPPTDAYLEATVEELL